MCPGTAVPAKAARRTAASIANVTTQNRYGRYERKLRCDAPANEGAAPFTWATCEISKFY